MLAHFTHADFYSISNMVFASTGAILSFTVLHFFGSDIAGLWAFYNTIDSLLDFGASHVRTSMESTVASRKGLYVLIAGFAGIQIVFSVISAIVFAILSFKSDTDISGYIALCFCLISPTKAGLSFWRIEAKIRSRFDFFLITNALMIALNCVLIVAVCLGISLELFLLIRTFVGFVIIAVLFLVALEVKRLDISFLKKILAQYVLKERWLFLLSLIILLSLTIDRLIMFNLFGSSLLGYYSLGALSIAICTIYVNSYVGAHYQTITSLNEESILQFVRALLRKINYFWTVFLVGIVLILRHYPEYDYSCRVILVLSPVLLLQVFNQLTYYINLVRRSIKTHVVIVSSALLVSFIGLFVVYVVYKSPISVAWSVLIYNVIIYVLTIVLNDRKELIKNISRKLSMRLFSMIFIWLVAIWIA